ncbi:MAG: dihydrodipicolinate synthase family protein, partial [Lachnospiraceae bacterium]|nr:dihydrodipicolinate synthase family protein [Lachnospiraceae bacterium]
MDFAEKFPGGVWPVMLTPYTEKGAIDEDALAALTEWYVGSGVKGLFAACQSSEIFYLNQKERLKIVEITMEAARGRVPVIASANTSEDIEAQAEELNAVWDLGVDAAILLSNRLAGPEDPEEVWTENFYRLLDRLNPDIRLGIYECPYPYKRILRSREIQAMVGTGKFHFLK